MHAYKMVLTVALCSFSASIFSADVQPEKLGANRLALIMQFDQYAKMALSPTGDKLALASRNKTNIWATDESREEPLLVTTDADCDKAISAVTFHPKEESFATACQKGCVCIYNTQTGNKISHVPTHCKSIYALALHPAKNECLIGNSCGEIELWSLERQQKLQSFRQCDTPVTQLAYNPSGEHFTAIHTHGIMERLDAKLERATKPTKWGNAREFWTNSQYIAKGLRNGSITLYEQSGSITEGIKPVFQLTEQQLGSTSLEHDYKEKFKLSDEDLANLAAGKRFLFTYATKIAAVGIAQNRLLIGLQHGELIELLWHENEDTISVATRQLLPAKPLSEQQDGETGSNFIIPSGKNVQDIVASADGSCFASLSRDLTMHRWPNGYSSPENAHKIHVWKSKPTEEEPAWQLIEKPKVKERKVNAEPTTSLTPAKKSKRAKRRDCVIS